MTMMSDFPWPVIFISVSGFGFIDPILSSSYFPLDWSATQLENDEARKKQYFSIQKWIVFKIKSDNCYIVLPLFAFGCNIIFIN